MDCEYCETIKQNPEGEYDPPPRNGMCAWCADEDEEDEVCENCCDHKGTVISEGKEALLLCQDCYEEEDDDWMEIYSHHPDFKVFCGDHEHLKPYHGFRYFQCWGGGDEGGFIMNDDDETFKVKRGWGEPFSVEPVDGILDIGHRDGVEQLRVIPKPCEMEDA